MKMTIKTKCKGKNVLLIVDYNLKTNKAGSLRSTYKIDQTFSSIRSILDKNPQSLTICSHLGRPKNKNSNSTIPIYKYLQQKIPNIKYVTIKEILKKYSNTIDDERNILLGIIFTDNSRYYNEKTLKEFYGNFDVIINDAFGCSHRKNYYNKAHPGILMQKEIHKTKNMPNFDLVIIGGSKIKDKLKYINNITGRIFLGGGLAISILKELSYEIGNNSIYSKFNIKELKKTVILDGNIVVSNESNNMVILPVDFLVINKNGEYTQKDYKNILENDVIIDVGDKSIDLINQNIKSAKSVFWNGPIGKYEDKNAVGTKKLIRTLELSSAKILIGGGESLDAVEKYSNTTKFYHVSTGGGAMLHLISGLKMPGLESLIL